MDDEIQVSNLEKIIVNAFTPVEFPFRYLPHCITQKKPVIETWNAVCDWKVEVYEQLIREKKSLPYTLPVSIVQQYRTSPCGWAARLALRLRE